MEHGRGTVPFEQLVHALPIAYAADLDAHVDIVVFGEQLKPQQIRVVLVYVEHNDTGRSHLGQLAAQFAADGTAASGDEDRFAGNVT